MPEVTISNGHILTLAGPTGPRRGDALHDLGSIENGWLSIDQGRIVGIGSGEPSEEMRGRVVLDIEGRVVLPTWVDCHTHACWAGNRLAEWESLLAGATYTDVLKAGGGIHATVSAVRDTDESTLSSMLLARIGRMQTWGTGTMEVKSGYGLNTETELRMLRAVHAAAQQADAQIAGTFLGAHAIDPKQPDFIDLIIEETLPTVAEEFPGITCDAYLEHGAWSCDDTRRLFERAKELNCPIRLHADQFNSLGGVPLAIEFGARSVDHLEAISEEDIKSLAQSDTIGVLLPASGFHLDGRYAPGRALIDAGAAIALATNYNPGSAPTPSMPMAIALATRCCGLSPAEAITAATWNAAVVLGLQEDVGSLEVGKRGDVQVLDERDPRAIAWEIGGMPPPIILLGGQPVQFLAEAGEEDGQDD